ncbi:ATP-binding cassette domain-containing protein [Ramlibacter henchirensis]|uniref:ATP-binding cassette domain-containing protein n=1 Tax=Ramlibacter henchirensis TaxID=204072 RepID=A0A4Z0C0M1_9BURK|nr:ABC transporter ATP-binding protein [Ramlibacter henchirensis]TFZ05157.1 ATP-binding cassette domain-containing protein [Ramlibacter henchirensis]
MSSRPHDPGSIALRVDQLSKCFHLYAHPKDRLKQAIVPPLRRLLGAQAGNYYSEFWALRNVSFELARGETIGIVGRNGSGKSTLLQIICGTLFPTTGQVETYGRVAALLELGSGFNPAFTGRDNIYLNAALLGLTQEETEARYDAIVDFAGIGDFIDQPVKNYSSGMVVRLGFAVQAQIDPDILVVDEALAVGDAKFQAKCFDRLRALKEAGTSIILVTHSSEQIVTHCSKALLLDGGEVLEIGEPRKVVNRYLDVLFGRERLISLDTLPEPRRESSAGDDPELPVSCAEDVFATHPNHNPHEYRWGDGTAQILDFHMVADGEEYPVVVRSGAKIRLTVSVLFMRRLIRPILGVTLKTKEGVTVYGANSETLHVDAFREMGEEDSVAVVEIEFSCALAGGDYFISLGIATRHGEEVVPHDRRYDCIHLIVGPEARFTGLADLGLKLQARKVMHESIA